METIVPENQTATINHSEDRIFDFNDINSRFFVGRTSNNLLKVFGDHLIRGFEVTPSIDVNGIATFDVNPGEVIIDSTIINFSTVNQISLDVSILNTSGKLFVSVDYSYIYTTRKNLAKLGCYYWLNDTVPNVLGFNTTKHIILGLYDFTLSPNTITEVPNPILNPISININSNNYEVRPLSNIDKRILNIINYQFN